MRVRWQRVVCGLVLLVPAYGGWALLCQSRPIAAEALTDRPEAAKVSKSDGAAAAFRVAARGRIAGADRARAPVAGSGDRVAAAAGGAGHGSRGHE